MKTYIRLLVFGFLMLPLWQVVVADDSLSLQKVTENIYAIVGDLGNRSPDNLGNNATFGFVITKDGVVLIDSGGSYQGAGKIAKIIKNVTDKPVIYVINTGGQDHRWMGNGYFKKLGAKIIASEKAVEDQKLRTQDQFIVLGALIKDEGLKGTDAIYADQTFKQKLEIKIGGTSFLLYHAGQAHTPGDSFVYLVKQQVMFTGDIVYVDRMLGVGSQSNSKSWLQVFEKMAKHKIKHLIPGHGKVTTLQQAYKDTYDYLLFLRKSVATFIKNGKDITDINQIDQAKFNYLKNYQVISGKNVQQVFIEMEWE
ncbi:MAG: MBL fold metallo-hydrolase [Gammaproteobacteria bacterium]|nr:MAG: MBL fold metallo-hydrolase [Gammaproteobacteria bacterium]